MSEKLPPSNTFFDDAFGRRHYWDGSQNIHFREHCPQCLAYPHKNYPFPAGDTMTAENYKAWLLDGKDAEGNQVAEPGERKLAEPAPAGPADHLNPEELKTDRPPEVATDTVPDRQTVGTSAAQESESTQ